MPTSPRKICQIIVLLLCACLFASCANPAATQSIPTSLPPTPTETSVPTVPVLARPTAIIVPTATIVPATQTENSPAQPERVQLEPGAVMAQIPGSLKPGASNRFVFGALKGQLLTVEITASPDSAALIPASFSLTGADGSLLTADTVRWKGALTISQNYFIEITSHSTEQLAYTLLVAIPAIGSTPYVPVTLEVCQMLQEMAARELSASFVLEASAPFDDYVTAETGQGCKLTATGSEQEFGNSSEIIVKLKNAFLGFSELPAYQASGPTGEAIAMNRDSAVVLISASWEPAPGASCPADQPISACELKPQKKIYTIIILAAMK